VRVCRVSPIGLSALSAELGLGRGGGRGAGLAFSLQHASGQERQGNKTKKVARRLSLQLYFNYYMTHSTDRHNPDVPAVNGYGVCGPDTALRTRGHRGTLEERKHLSSTQRLITGGSLESAPLICSRPCRTAVVAVPCTLTCAAAVA